MMRYKNIRIIGKIMLIVILMTMIIKIPIVYAIENDLSNVPKENTQPTVKDGTTIGSGDNLTKSPEKENGDQKTDKSPSIEEATVLGDFNKSETGVGYFKDISIALIGENLTDDHFLAPEGLHWSDKTAVELIKGNEIGDYDFSAFSQEAPNKSIKAYSINNGDSGRITNVGKTKSGINLDLIWTVTGSDKEDWATNSGYNDNRIKGLGFIGEQFFPGAKGNSIAVLYNNASNLGLHYKIVKHGTTEEQPVIISFISTDIDSAQGVETDLANIVEIIPEGSNLVKKDGIIYDSTKGVVNLNGSVNLPRGGYLGAGFLSNFNYVFYSPAPERVNDSYYYPIAVRYDIFGSGLQAKLLIKINQHITVHYLDKMGKELKPKEFFKGFTDESYTFKSLDIPKYKLIDITKDDSDIYHPVVKFIYSPEYEIKFKFIDENGRPLSSEIKYTFLDGKEINYKPIEIKGYESPSEYKGIITKDTEHIFVYKKIKVATSNNYHPSDIDDTKENSTTLSNVETNHDNKDIYNKSSYIVSKKEESDPFLVNTKMSKDEKKQFLDYINEITNQAKKKYGNDKNKINHAIANAIAYPVYHNDKLQSKVNDFGKKPNVINYEYMSEFLYNVHRDEKYFIDFPHLATTLASAEDSGKWKGIIKWISGFSISNLWENSTKDNFFQLNSLTGDFLSNIDEKDYRSDIDAIIFHYHPNFKDLTLDEAIKKYYHIENLDIERRRFYKEVLKLQAGKGVTEKEQELLNIFSATSTLGGAWLVLLTLLKKSKKEFKEFIKFPPKYICGVSKAIDSMGKPLEKDLWLSKRKILNLISIFAGYSLALGGVILNISGKKIYYNAIEPIPKFFNKNVIQPINKKIIKPVLKNVVKPIVQKVVKPTVKFIDKKIIQPIINKVIKPAVKFISNKIVKPIINKAIKSTVKYVRQNIVKPVVNFVKNKLVKPVGNFFKKLWRWRR